MKIVAEQEEGNEVQKRLMDQNRLSSWKILFFYSRYLFLLRFLGSVLHIDMVAFLILLFP